MVLTATDTATKVESMVRLLAGSLAILFFQLSRIASSFSFSLVRIWQNWTVTLISRNKIGGDAGVNPIVAATPCLEELMEGIVGVLWLLTRDVMLGLNSIDSGSMGNWVMTMEACEEKAICLMVSKKWKEKNQPRLDIVTKGITRGVHIPQQDPISWSCYDHPINSSLIGLKAHLTERKSFLVLKT